MTRIRLSKEERKAQIKQSAIELFTEKGFGNTSVQEIIDRACLSKGGFYHYYSSKENLFREILEDGMEYRKDLIIEYRDEHKKLDRRELLINLLLDKILDHNDYKKMFVKLMLEMPSNPKLKKIFEDFSEGMNADFIEFCQKEGFTEYIDITNDEFGMIISSLMIGVTIFDYGNDEKMRQTLQDMLEVYFDKIGLWRET